ncbi:flagellar hook-associated protein FlgK [Neorhizobium sp. NPDC001467]|uniref:flagellar hook-associated protein FlgK n=1 Tax=Neorhizobium sp. NPDC001467 TaxID=3390595 RepID=UPI003D0476F6
MSISAALSTAQQIFNNTGTQTSVTSTNIANTQNANYAKRTAVLVSNGNGALVASTTREQNEPLLRQTIASTALASGQSTLAAGLEEIRSLLGGNDYETSMSTKMTTLLNNLGAYAAKPSEATLAATAVSSAQDVVNTLRTTSTELQAIRARTDAELKTQVDKLNNLLSQFEAANTAVVQAQAINRQDNNALDTRDTLLKQISEIVGISSTIRAGGDMALYTSDGTTLFETIPRAVTFTPTKTYTAATEGSVLRIDGFELKPGVGGETSASGSLQALLQIRDDIAPTFQSQLDEIARGLIVAFAETGPNDDQPALAGLFTNGIDKTVNDSGSRVVGLAATISVNAFVKDKPTLLRDGDINGASPAYAWNPTADSSYSALLDHYSQMMQAKGSFDEDTAVGGTDIDLMSFASDSTGWLEALRSSSVTATETKTAMQSRAAEALSSETGVSLDEELSLLLDIEQSYKAATKLVSTIDEMISALLTAAG